MSKQANSENWTELINDFLYQGLSRRGINAAEMSDRSWTCRC